MPSLSSHFFRFILRTTIAPFLRSGPIFSNLQKRMELTDRLMGTPRYLRVARVDAGGVPAEWEVPTGAADERVLLYFHGGAWVYGSPASYRGMVGQLARAAGVKALSVEYRLAPQYPFPIPLEDCLAAYRWLLGQGYAPNKIALGGDSAGGNLVLAALLALRDAGDPMPAAAVCLSPATDLTCSGESMRTRREREVLLNHLVSSANNPGVVPYYAAGHDLRDPLLSPLFGDLRGLPPILIHVGDDEILLSDSTQFVERACAAGVDARVVVWPAMWHVFQMHAPLMPEARESLRQLGEFIRAKLES
jgi:acetyl esterase/lipase